MKLRRTISFLIDQELNHDKSKVIVLVGQRQVGKTSELYRLREQEQKSLYFDFDDVSVRDLFSPSVAALTELLGPKHEHRLLLLDEVQHLQHAGSILKLIYDHFPETKIVVTGSAAFLLLRSLGDSLAGRYLAYDLHGLSIRELLDLPAPCENFVLGSYAGLIEKPRIDALIQTTLSYGSLPEIALETDRNRKEKLLSAYTDSLLYKDIFEIEGIRHPHQFKRLLQLLALQIGSEINPNELAKKLELNRKTILTYIHLFEKFRIIHRLPAYSTNPRKEITKGFKVYFSDLGIRNAIIDQFSSAGERVDLGGLFENLVVNIFRQHIDYQNVIYDMFYWRNYASSEVDLVLRHKHTRQLVPIEIKAGKQKQPARAFFNAYNNNIESSHGIHMKNIWKYI